jgi:hypothetical protein
LNVGELLVKIGANTRDLKKGVAEAKREVASLPDSHTVKLKVDNNELRKAASGGGGRGGSFLDADLTELPITMKALIGALPILSSAIVTTTGALGGLASMFGTATIGAIGFGAVTVGVLGDVFDAQKNIEKANSDLAKATTQEEQKTAIDNLHQAYMGLDQGQLAALGSLEKFKNFWNSFKSSFQAPVVVAFSKALEGLQYFLEGIGPAIQATGAAVVGIFQRMNDAMKGADFQKAFSWLGTSAGGAISTFGDIAIKVFQGVLNLMVAFQPLSDSMQGGLVGMAQAFLEWTQSLASSEAFKQFINYVLATGPQLLMFFKVLMTTIFDLITVLAPLGNVMLGALNMALSFINVLFNLMFGVGDLKSRIDDLKNSFLDLGSAIGIMLGYKTVDTTSRQTDQVSDLNQAYKDVVGSVGDVGSGLKDAGKDAQKFLASFDEMYQIPDKLDNVAGALPKPPTPPGGGGGGGGLGPIQGPQLIKELKDQLDALPRKIDITINPTPADMGASVAASSSGAWVAAGNAIADAVSSMKLKFNELMDKLNEIPPVTVTVSQAFATMLNSMQSSLNAYNPYITFGFDLLVFSMTGIVLQAPTTSFAFSTMLNDMQVSLNAYEPYLAYGLGLIVLAMNGINIQAPTTSAAFAEMLNKMQSDLNAFQPYISYGLLLIALDIAGIIPVSEETGISFHAMLDSMQSNINAYQPYISFGLTSIVLSLLGLQSTVNDTKSNWNEAWAEMYNTIHNTAANIVKDINSVTEAYNRMNEAMDKETSTNNGSSNSGSYSYPVPAGPAVPSTSDIIAGTAETFDFNKALSDAAKSLLEAGVDMGITAIGGKGVQLGGAVAKDAAEEIAKGRLKTIIESMMKRRNVTDTPSRARDAVSGELGNVSGFASGGIIGSESIVRVGESGKREAIIPLESGAMNPFADAVADRLGGSGGGVNIEIKGNIYGGPSGIKELARLVNQALRNEAGRGATT